MANLQTMSNNRSTKRAERSLSQTGVVWPKSVVARPEAWRKAAHSASWNNLAWSWTKLGISASGRKAAESLELTPSEVFAHPDMISAHPEMSDYYRLMAFLPKKGLARIRLDPGPKETLAFCRFVNRYLSCLVTAAAKASRQSRLNPILDGAGKKQGNWEDHYFSPKLKAYYKVVYENIKTE